MRKFFFLWPLFTLCITAYAAEAPFVIKAGDEITIVSDKGVRSDQGNHFEAIGNVIIMHKDETLYGQRATLDQSTGEVHLEGHVRYVGPMLTLYGQKLNYNTYSHFLSVQNGVVVAQGFSVVGEYFARISPKEIVARNAEYTTCRDCPEAWAVYGKEIFLTLDEYIHIKNALVKSHGTTILYLPYVVFPVKKTRQTGLLFPEISFSSKRGLLYRQPVYVTLGDNKDITLTPSVLGVRGFGQGVQYRHVLGEAKWYEIDLLTNSDLTYLPGDDDRVRSNPYSRSGNSYQRFLGQYEHHYQWNQTLNHHFVFTKAREVDFFADFERYSSRFSKGTDLPQWGFFDLRNSLISVSAEASHNQNLMVSDPVQFDENYVQLMPKLSLQMMPIPVWQSDIPFLQHISFGTGVHFTYFKQGRPQYAEIDKAGTKPDSLILNAQRIEFYPYVNWVLGQIGPLSFETQLAHFNQYYRFPRLEDRTEKRSFYKSNALVTSRMFFEVERIWGPAYVEKVPVEKIEYLTPQEFNGDKEKRTESCGKKCLGELPPIETNESIEVARDGHRHSFLFDVRHYYSPSQSFSGNNRFRKQIEYSEGAFDDFDYPEKIRTSIGSLEARKDIPKRNTIELQLTNSLYRKKARYFDYNRDGLYLSDNFIYSLLAYFSVSQGFVVEKGPQFKEFKDRLTRLYVSTGVPLGDWNLSLDEYYFYKMHKQEFYATASYKSSYLNFSLKWRLSTLSTPSNKELNLTLDLYPISTIRLIGQYDYDFTKHNFIGYSAGIEYSPLNNCWKTGLVYNEKTRDVHNDKEFLFNIMVNFGDNKFTSILQPGQNSDY